MALLVPDAPAGLNWSTVAEQYIAASISRAPSVPNGADELCFLRFNRDDDLESAWLPIAHAEVDTRETAPVSKHAARRLLSGRTVFTRDRADIAVLRSVLELPTGVSIVSLDELAETFLLSDVLLDVDRDPWDSRGPEEIAHAVRQVMSLVSEYDSITLTRASSLAIAAGWAVAALLRDEIEQRETQPILLRPDHRYGALELNFLTSRERPEPLKRTGSNAEIAISEIEGLLGSKGGFSRVMPGFEVRRAQQQMATVVTGALNDDGWLLVEAGTGTGKSMAYLLPAARFAMERGERVVISTNTKALQDQLMVKDLPDVQRALVADGRSEKLRAAVVKGRSNYLCLRRWFAHERQPVVASPDAGLRAKVNLWMPLTESGDRSELRLTGDEEHEFNRVSAEGEACNASRCVYQQRNQCFLFRARRNAENAHLVVVNHALMLSDSGGESSILPDYERLIIDEAHHLEDQATSQFGLSIQELAIPELVDTFVRHDGPTVAGLLVETAALFGRSAVGERDMARAAAARERIPIAQIVADRVRTASLGLFGAIRTLTEQIGTQDMGYGRTLRVTPAVRRSPAWSEIEIAFDRLNSQVQELEDQMRWSLAALHEQHPDDDDFEEAQDPFEDLQIELGAAIERCLELSANLGEMILSASSNNVYWTSISATANRLSVNSAPLHVGDMLRATLLERLRTVVMTSATLSTDGSFAYVKDRLSFSEASELELESPFDYRKSALLYLVDDIPEPNAPDYQPMLEQAIIDLGKSIDGRTLVLFTSHSALRATHRAIRQPLADAEITVLAQRADGSPRQLIEQFKSTSRTMLLGTSTFWEGVDIVGDALSALVIAKLPFAVPSDPIVAARAELFEDAFKQYSIPQAVLRFKQGFGRLIRASSDRGICVVLDRRAISKRYGATFVQSLPHCSVQVGSRTRIGEHAQRWISQDRQP